MTTTRDEFRALARHYRAIPVHRELLADMATPVSAFLRCVGDESGFALESVENGERWSRFSFVGRRPHATLTARGLDVEHITHVVNLELPRDTETYVHRIGRTGRVGREGTAITFITARHVRKIHAFAKDLGVKIPQHEVPGDAEVQRHLRKRR